MKIKPPGIPALGMGIKNWFVVPALAMVAWGAFVSMMGYDWPRPGYWEFFMLRIVAYLVMTTSVKGWKSEKEGEL